MYSRNDKLAIKIIVHLIFALDFVQSILTVDDIFFWFVYNFGDAQKLLAFHWAFDIPALDAVIGFIVQAVYCWRIWVLSGWRLLPILTAVVSLLAGTAGLACGIRFQVQDGPSLAHGFNVAILLWLVGSAVTDVVIASSMTYVLLRVRKDSIGARSSVGAKLLRLLTLTLETNAITAAAAIVTVVLFLTPAVAPPKGNFYQLGGFLLGKLYSNCFMILLNQRYSGGHPNSEAGSRGASHGSRSGEIGLVSRNPVGSRTITVDDPRQTSPKGREFPEEGTYKSQISLGV